MILNYGKHFFSKIKTKCSDQIMKIINNQLKHEAEEHQRLKLPYILLVYGLAIKV